MSRDLIKKKFEVVSEIEELERYGSMKHDKPNTIHFEVVLHYGTCRDSEKILISRKHNARLRGVLDDIIRELEKELEALG